MEWSIMNHPGYVISNFDHVYDSNFRGYNLQNLTTFELKSSPMLKKCLLLTSIAPHTSRGPSTVVPPVLFRGVWVQEF